MKSCQPVGAGAPPMYPSSGRDVVQHDVDLDGPARVDLHLAAHEVPWKARWEHVDVVLAGHDDDLERTRSICRARMLHVAWIAEVDRGADGRHAALVFDRALYDHAATNDEIHLDVSGAQADLIGLDPVALAIRVLCDVAAPGGR